LIGTIIALLLETVFWREKLKKALIIPLIIIFAGSIFSAENTFRGTRYNKRTNILTYRKSSDVNERIKALYALASSKDIKLLELFVNDLCFTGDLEKHFYRNSGILDHLRYNIAIALRNYKDSSEPELTGYFNAMRRLVEQGKIHRVVGATAITLSIWTKGMGKPKKDSLVSTIDRRVSRMRNSDVYLAREIAVALGNVKTDESKIVLNRMLLKGYNNNLKRFIQKIIGNS
jgi:hypothetical protein